MNRIIKAALMIAATTLMVACAKENNVPVIENQGTIEISIDGVMGGYASQDVTKSEIQTVARLMWSEGDKVYAYDGTTYLGELTASIADTDGTVAKLSGSITAPSGTKPITLVHSPLFTGQPEVADGKISLDFSCQNQANVPFLVYSVLPSNTTADALNNNYVAKFNIATSIYKCNIAGLPEEDEVDEVRVYSVNTVCNLQLSDSEVPAVTGSNPGVITRTDGIMAADQRAIVTIALVESPAESRKIEVLKGDCYYDANFATSAIAPAKSYNAVFAVKKAQLTVRFNLNGHGSTPIADQVLDKNAAEAGWIIKPSDPTASGYTFDGWYTESTCENAWDFNEAIDFSEPQPDVLTLYAKWEEGEIPDVLPGVFSVSLTKTVKFSKGNLRYTIGTGVWSFFNKQYECGPATYSEGHDREISLFNWGYDAAKSIIPDGTDYVSEPTTDKATFAKSNDWGYVFGGETSTWRTLTTEEWDYLAGSSRMTNGKPSLSYSYDITIGGNSYNGIFLYPDNYNDELVSSEMNWNDIYAANIVFLPAAGCMNKENGEIEIFRFATAGYYWSSSSGENSPSPYPDPDEPRSPLFSYCKVFYNGTFTEFWYPRFTGCSVRLVTDVN